MSCAHTNECSLCFLPCIIRSFPEVISICGCTRDFALSNFFHYRESGNSTQVKAGLLTCAGSVRAEALAVASPHQSCFATSRLYSFHEAWIKWQPMHCCRGAGDRLSSLLIALQSTLSSLAVIENEILAQSVSKASLIFPVGLLSSREEHQIYIDFES